MNIFTTQSEPGSDAFGMELLAAHKNGFEFCQSDDTKHVFAIVDDGSTIGTQLLCPAHTLDLLNDNYPDGIPVELLSDKVIMFLAAGDEPPITDADAEADLAGAPRPDNPSAEATAMQEAEHTKPINHTVDSICKQLDQIIGNTLEINSPIEPKRADTLLKLANLKSVLEGTD